MLSNNSKDSINYISIGKQIQKARIRANMTQEELSELVETSPNYISNIERGTKHASFDMLLKIAKALKTRLDIFLEQEYENEMNNQSIIQEINMLANGLPENRRNEFLKLIRKLAEGFEEI